MKILMYGITGGIGAGVVFILAEMIINDLLGKSFWGPPRLISSIVLGKAAIMPPYSMSKAVIVGFIVHFIIAAIFGVIVVAVLQAIRVGMPNIHLSMGLLLLYGAVAGCVTWLIDFHVIAPAAFPQFTKVNDFWIGFIAHTVFFGLVLGAYLAMVMPSKVRA